MGNRLRKAPRLRVRGAEFGYGAVLLVFFASGVLLGCFLCDRMDTEKELALYLSAFLAHSETLDVSFWAASWLYFRYPLLALVLSLLPVGFLFLPLFLFFLGAELSFSVAAFLAVFGKSGVWAALCALGIRAALVLPCCFFIACGALYRRARETTGKKLLLRFICMSGILGSGICLEIFLVPRLLIRVLAGMNF